MKITVRSVQLEDAPALVELLNPIIAAGMYTIMTEPATLDYQQGYLKTVIADGVCNVAVDESGDIVGLQSVDAYFASTPALRHIGDIGTYVNLEMRGSGIGSALIRETLPAAREKGFLKILALIRADNPDAQVFYQRHGFETIGVARKHARIGDRFVDEVLVELLLDH